MRRVRSATPAGAHRLRLVLTDGSVIERDVGSLLVGPVFDPIRGDPSVFRQVRVERGTLMWPGEADLCPDVLIWGGPPPESIAPDANETAFSGTNGQSP